MRLKFWSPFYLKFRIATVIVFTSMTILSAAVLWGVHTNLERIAEERLAAQSLRIRSQILDRIDSYVNALVAVRGLLILEGDLTPEKFKIFVSGIEADKRHPGGLGVGYAAAMPTGKVAQLESDMRKIGEKNFHVWPRRKAALATSILFLEPRTWRNDKAIGFDMMSEEFRRRAMEASMMSGLPTVSDPVVLVQEDQDDSDSQAGFLIYLPFYGERRAVPMTAEERRRFIKGFVYAPIRSKDFFDGIFGAPTEGNETVNFRIEYDVGAGGKAEGLYHRFAGETPAGLGAGVTRQVLSVRNARWILTVWPTTDLLNPSEKSLYWVAYGVIMVLAGIVLFVVRKAQRFMTEQEAMKRHLQEASRAKSYFLANMSHEIRTPLGAIVGFSDALCRENLTPRQKKDFAWSIRRNSDVLARIIDDVLDLSKIEAGKLHLEVSDVGIPTLLAEIQSVMDLQARKKPGVHFHVETRGDIPEFLQTDDIRLKQILMNLIGNGLKFTEKGRVRLIFQIQKSDEGEFAEFTVEDTGVGIPLEAQPSLFGVFAQGDSSTTRRFGGTGLGLALSRNLALMMGGDVRLAESRPNQGSRFVVTLPLKTPPHVRWLEDWRERKPEAPTPASTQSEELLAGYRVLLVEDSVDNQEIFRFFLETAGANLDIVDNGLDAVEHVRRQRYDLVLMDIQIPGIDGKEATRRIRNMGYRGPVVALTAHAMPEESASCIQAGCNGQITKPVTGEQLIRESFDYIQRVGKGGRDEVRGQFGRA